MRSPVLAITLVAAAVATVSANSWDLSSSDAPLAPSSAHASVDNLHVKSPRQYPSEAPGSDVEPSRDLGRDKGQIDRQRADSSRDRPNISHLSDAFPAAAQGTNGGTSTTSPAIGADASQGGGSASSADGDQEDGANIYKYLKSLTSTRPAVPASPPNSGEDDSYAFKPEDSAYSYRMKRVTRGGPGELVYRRKDAVNPSGLITTVEKATDDADGGSSSDNSSNNAGADGQSIKGSEHQGGGTNGGHAQSGEPGPSNGGRVYNNPRGNAR